MQYNNGFEPKPEMDDFDDDIDDDDDDSSNFVPEESSSRPKKKVLLGKSKAPVQKKPKKTKESKVLHKCDQCDAKYSSLCEYAVH